MAGSRAGSPMSRLSPNVLTFERPASFICHWATTPLVHKPRVFVKSYFTTTDLCKNLERVGIIIARSCHWSHRRITEGFPLVSLPTLDLSIYDQKSDWFKGFCYLMMRIRCLIDCWHYTDVMGGEVVVCGICSVSSGECLVKLIVCVLAVTATTIWSTWWQHVQLCRDHNTDPSTLLHHPAINLRPLLFPSSPSFLFLFPPISLPLPNPPFSAPPSSCLLAIMTS